jgi:transcriptional regulator with XRE-family HTH domain
LTQFHDGQHRGRKIDGGSFAAQRAQNAGNSVDASWFQHKLIEARLSQRQLAKLIGLDHSAVSLMFRGKRRMAADEAASIARLLGVDVAEVMRHGGIDVRGVAPDNPATLNRGVGNAPTPQHNTQQPAGNAEKITEKIVSEFPENSGCNSFVEIPVPISGGFTAILKIPRDFSRDDADRIAAIIVAFSQQK